MRFLLACYLVLAALSLSPTLARAGDASSIRIGTYTVSLGQEVTVWLWAVDISAPGIGAWTIDVVYDPAIVDANSCESQQLRGDCSLAFAEDTVRSTGVHNTGLMGNSPLAAFDFRCNAIGTTDLSLDVQVLATEPAEELVVSLEGGAITCTDAGQTGVIRIGTYEDDVGEEVVMVLEAVAIPEPAMGVWAVDVSFDTTIGHARDCTPPLGGVCNPAFSDNTVRWVGNQQGLARKGVSQAGTFSMICDSPGTTDLEVSLALAVALLPGDPIVIPEMESGTLTCREPGQDGVIRAGSYEAMVGDDVTVTLEAVDIPPPGLGAWTVDITYDPSVVTAIDCEALGNSVCSPLFMDDTVRSTGASATGLVGTLSLAKFGFKCDVPGVSDLTVQLSIFTDASFLQQVLIPDVEDGSITCEEPGQDGFIRIGSYEGVVGEEVTATLEAVDIPAEDALGVWTVDITYDTSVVSLIDCNALLGGVCIPAHSEDTFRVTGASAGGLSGTATLADIVFACSRAGTTDLAVRLFIGGSFTVGEEPSIPDPVSGTITCTEAGPAAPTELPTTGGAEPQPGSPSATMPLAILGAVLLAGVFALRRYALR